MGLRYPPDFLRYPPEILRYPLRSAVFVALALLKVGPCASPLTRGKCLQATGSSEMGALR
jgi:hypothetical protein